jgi:hypothetical protein
MISVRSRGRIILAVTILLIVLMILGMASVIFPRSIRDAAHVLPTPMTTPGLVVYGVVRGINGSGVGGVEIYRSYASYPGVVIATTEANGDFQSDFYGIPGDEMVSVWAEGLGYEYEPEQYYWRHYYGYEEKDCSFFAHLPSENYLPIVTRK